MSFPKLPVDIVNMHTFPHPEGTHFEYKAGIRSCSIEKVYETICGFLNVGGGYMIFGIDDDTLSINGVDNTKKEIDIFILRIDNIIHHGIIINHDGLKLDRSNLIVDSLELHNGKYLIIITVKSTPFTSYRLRDGTQIYRINASNQNLGRGARITSDQQRQRNYQHTQSMRTQINAQKSEHEEEVARLERRIRELETEKEVLKKEVNKLNRRLDNIKPYMTWGQWFRSFFI